LVPNYRLPAQLRSKERRAADFAVAIRPVSVAFDAIIIVKPGTELHWYHPGFRLEKGVTFER
jgi:hypothetical protein